MRREFSVRSGEDFALVEALIRALLRCEPRGGAGFLRSEAFLRLRMCAIYGRACDLPVIAWLHDRRLRVSLEMGGCVLVADGEDADDRLA